MVPHFNLLYISRYYKSILRIVLLVWRRVKKYKMFYHGVTFYIIYLWWLTFKLTPTSKRLLVYKTNVTMRWYFILKELSTDKWEKWLWCIFGLVYFCFGYFWNSSTTSTSTTFKIVKYISLYCAHPNFRCPQIVWLHLWS